MGHSKLVTNKLVPLPDSASGFVRVFYQFLYFLTKNIYKIIWLALISLFFVTLFFTSDLSTAEVKIDSQNIYVSDNAHLLSEHTKQEIKDYNEGFKSLKTKPQLLVVTIDRLPFNTTIEQYTNDLATRLGVGSKEYDSGVVYLVTRKNRQARLEVGYGMEGTITDAATLDITDKTVKDYYRTGNYNAGVALVAARINQLIQQGYLTDGLENNISQKPVSRSFSEEIWQALTQPTNVLIFLLMVIVVVVFLTLISKTQNFFGKRYNNEKLLADFKTDLLKTNPNVNFADLNSLAATKEQLLVNLVADKTSKQPDMPAYTKFDFAFGNITKAGFLKTKDDHNTDLKNLGWISEKVGVLDKLATRIEAKFKKFAKIYTVSEDEQNKLASYYADPSELKRLEASKIGLWLLAHIPLFVLILLIVGSVFINKFGALRNNNILAQLLGIFNFYQTPLHFVYSASVIGLLILGWIICWLAQLTLFDEVKQRIRLNHVMIRYFNDLRKELNHAISNQEIVEKLDNDDSELLQAKVDLLQKLGPKTEENKEDLPDYYDMSFAFGTITLAQFLNMSKPVGSFRDSTVYYSHQADWYSSGSDSGSSDSSSSGDSFGGGSFGGGGGTSSW